MGDLIELNFGSSFAGSARLGTLRVLAGMAPEEFAAAIQEEAGEPVPGSVYIAYEADDAGPRRIHEAARVVAGRNEAGPREVGRMVFGLVDVQRLGSALRNGWPVDPVLLEQLESAHELLNARSEIEPPRVVKPDLCCWLHVLLDLLRLTRPSDVGDRLRSIAARAANHLGYLSFRDLRRADAVRYYELSLQLAIEARDDRELAILLLRRQRLVAATDGLPAAVDMVESVGSLLEAGAPSGLTAWRWGERARQEALLGDEYAARRNLELALSAAERDPGRLNLFAPDKDSRWLQRRPAYVALHLGHGDEAIRLLEQNRAGSDPTFVRETVWNSVELGEAWAAEGELDTASEYLSDGVDLSVMTEDVRALSFIRKVRRQRLARWGGDPRLRRLDERIRCASLR